MKKNGKSIFFIEFILMIFVFGIMSDARLIDSYIHPKRVNNKFYMNDPVEQDLAYNFWGKDHFINVNGAICDLMGKSCMNDVVKLDNGYLYTPIERTSDQTLCKYADSTRKLNDYLKKRGSTLVYVTTPVTVSKYDPELPAGIEDHGNENIDRFLKLIEEAGIDIIDIRKEMYEDRIDQYEMMYKTDLHWKTDVGIYVYKLLEDYITDKTGCATDARILDPANYTVTVYEKWHLGSRGYRTGIYFAGIDDFSLITPRFDTLLTDGNGTEGSMQELMLDMTPLQNRDYTARYTYDDVLKKTYGDFTNQKSMNDIRILLISDSMGKAVIPYLAMGFKYVHSVRNYYSEMITPEYIEAYDPDVVILLYYPEYLMENKEGFSFQNF
ncbi:MAG: hypothetical protein K5697_16380 [Lachnospiraceae bacterium]|nr:hypothetical protein [Lachnospiraceae bacterium]